MSLLGTSSATPDSSESDVLLRTLSDAFSKDTITVVNGSSDAELRVGSVLGEVKYAAVAEPGCVGSGDGTLTAISLGKNAKIGDYTVLCTTGGASAVFSVTGPDGYLIGIEIGHNADFESPHINFTLTAGSAAFAKGDTFTVTVSSPSSKVFKVVDETATDGTQVAAAVLLRHLNMVADEQVDTIGLVGMSHVKSGGLIFPDSFTSGEEAVAVSQLKSVGIAAV
jgi:head decoration protein D